MTGSLRLTDTIISLEDFQAMSNAKASLNLGGRPPAVSSVIMSTNQIDFFDGAELK